MEWRRWRSTRGFRRARRRFSARWRAGRARAVLPTRLASLVALRSRSTRGRPSNWHPAKTNGAMQDDGPAACKRLSSHSALNHRRLGRGLLRHNRCVSRAETCKVLGRPRETAWIHRYVQGTEPGAAATRAWSLLRPPSSICSGLARRFAGHCGYGDALASRSAPCGAVPSGARGARHCSREPGIPLHAPVDLERPDRGHLSARCTFSSESFCRCSRS